MAEEHGEDIELEDYPDMSSFDYDLEYLLRKRKNTIDIRRDRLDEAKFEKGFKPAKISVRERLEKLVVPPEPVKSALTPPCSRQEWLQFLLTHVPILSWVWSYRPGFLVGDLIAGITVAIMHIPQGLAYAILADVPPVYGLYASLVPPIIYALFGTSRHISVGTFAVVQLMIANAIERVLTAHSLDVCFTGEFNGTMLDGDQINELLVPNGTATCGELKVDIAVTLAFTSGAIMALFGLFQLGFIAIFLSEPLVSGYTTGAAVHVFTSQLRHIFGLEIRPPAGLFRVPKTWLEAFKLLPETNAATVVVSIITIILLILMKIGNKWLQKRTVPIPVYSRRGRGWKVKRVKWSIPLPSQLIVVILATGISYGVHLSNRFQVDIVGDIPQGPPAISTPKPEYMLTTLQDAFVISIVTFSVSVSLAQVFARQFDYSIHSSQEFIAYGAMNLVGAFFSSFTAAGSLSRSTIQANSGGKTQLVSLVSSSIILVVLVGLSFLFEPLPKCVLASIIWVALYGMFKQTRDVWKYFKLSVWDMLVWLVVFISTVLLGVDLGLAVGIGCSLFFVILRTILPYSSVLGQARNTEIYRNMENFEEVQHIPGVLIYRFQAPLCFVNGKVFRSRLEMASRLDKEGMNRREPGCIEQLVNKLRLRIRAKRHYVVTHEGRPREGSGGQEPVTVADTSLETNITRTFSFQQAVGEDIVGSNLNRVVPDDVTVRLPTQEQPTETVIIDCAPIGFMDAVGVKTILQIVLDFDRCGVQVVLAALTKENRDILERAGFYSRCGKEWLFPSIQDAVHHAKHGSKLHPRSINPTTLQEERDREEQEEESTEEDDGQQETPDRASPDKEPPVDQNGRDSPKHVDVEIGNSSHSE